MSGAEDAIIEEIFWEDLHFHSILSAVEQMLGWVVESNFVGVPEQLLGCQGFRWLWGIASSETTHNSKDPLVEPSKGSHSRGVRRHEWKAPVWPNGCCIVFIGRPFWICDVGVSKGYGRVDSCGFDAVGEGWPVSAIRCIVPSTVRGRVLGFYNCNYQQQQRAFDKLLCHNVFKLLICT